MSTYQATGLRGNWLNGWLAAIGIAVLLPDARLSWSSDAIPTAIFEFPGDLADELARAIPSEEDLSKLAIARTHEGSKVELQRKVRREDFADRSRLARSSHDGSLEATITDLGFEDAGFCAHAPLDPPVPKGLTLHDRLVSIRAGIDRDSRSAIEASLKGRAQRRRGNGLGFDMLRFPAGVQAQADVQVDPFIELACFFGMLLMPVRGNGTTARQRGWSNRALSRHAFSWPVWEPSIDRWGIDALLDIAWGGHPQSVLKTWGITGLFGSVAQQPRSTSDVSRAYGSERLW
jgi:hypothetical protein